MRSVVILVLFWGLFSSVYGQTNLEVDTISVSIFSPKKKKAYGFDYKTKFVLLENSEKIKDQNKVHDYLITFLDPPKQGYLYLKIYRRNGKLFASGKWNEMGFLDVVSYYKRGEISKKASFNQGTFVKYQ